MTWAPSYVTPEELAAFVRIGDTDDDEQLELAIGGASRAIDDACRRQFGQDAAPVARHYAARYVNGRWVADTDDLMTTEGLVVEVDTVGDGTYAATVTGYVLSPRNAPADGEPWTRVTIPASSGVRPHCAAEDGVRVTARFGWSAVPAPVRQACLLQASRVLARRDSPYGVAGSPEAGTELRLLAKVDPDVAVLLRALRRRWWAV
jgi:hypothetical protein